MGWGDGVVRVYVARSLLLGCAVVPSETGERTRTATASSSSSRLPLPAPAAWELESQFEPSPPASPVTSLCWRPHYAGAPGQNLPPLLAVGTAARRQRQRRGGIGNDENGAAADLEGGGSSIWLFRTPLLRWTRACTLDPSSTGACSDVSAVAWAPAGSPAAPERVATAAGEKVRVFALAGAADALVAASSSSSRGGPGPGAPAPSSSAPVRPEAILRHSAPVWKLEWAPLGGGWLAAGTEEGAVALWRQDLRGAWAAQSAIVCDDRARQQQMEQQQQQEAAATSGLATVVV